MGFNPTSIDILLSTSIFPKAMNLLSFIILSYIFPYTALGKSSYSAASFAQFTKNVDSDNADALRLLTSLYLDNGSGWTFVNVKDGVSVFRRPLSAGLFVHKFDREKGEKHACVKSQGVIKVINCCRVISEI